MLPSGCHAIDLDPIANSTITVNLDRSFEELLRDSNISVHTRTVISLLMEEKRRHMKAWPGSMSSVTTSVYYFQKLRI